MRNKIIIAFLLFKALTEMTACHRCALPAT